MQREKSVWVMGLPWLKWAAVLGLAIGVCLGSTGCVSSLILASGKRIDHLARPNRDIKDVRRSLGEPVWTQAYSPPLMIRETEEYRAWNQRLGHDPVVVGVDDKAKDSIAGVCEVYRLTELVFDPLRADGYGMALGLSWGLAELADPFLIPDAIRWRREHAHDESWHTYWFGTNGHYVAHFAGDIRDVRDWPPLGVPSGIDHGVFDRLLQRYVGEDGRVDYASWKANRRDLRVLRDYTKRFSVESPRATGDEEVASLINTYNALTLLWVLDHYPVNSIRNTEKPWDAKRHPVGGRLVSLDELEHDVLRPLAGYRVHAALVCAARSCPPLWNRAYTAENLDQQLDGAMRRWLAREDLHRFVPAENRVELSKIIEWYQGDFEKADGGLRGVLRRFGPEEFRGMLGKDYRVTYREYDWSLNGVESID